VRDFIALKGIFYNNCSAVIVNAVLTFVRTVNKMPYKKLLHH